MTLNGHVVQPDGKGPCPTAVYSWTIVMLFLPEAELFPPNHKIMLGKNQKLLF